MDEDQEIDRFRKRKGKRHQTKDEALYGIFADTDSASEGGSHTNKRRKQDLTKPLNFVMPCQKIDQDSKDNNEKENLHDEDPVIGFVATSLARSGLGPKNMKGDEVEVNDTSVDLFSSAFSKRLKERILQSFEEMEKSKLTKKSSQVRSGNVGIFEKHTKGIGSKLLEKMGYKGGGLGRNAQGIVAPIEAKLRPKNTGIGYNEYKKTVNLPVLQEPLDQNTRLHQSISESQLKEKMWSKQRRSKKKKKDHVTTEELLVKKQEKVQKVLDMRGPQVRVITNLENLNADVPMPELQRNVRLVLDLAELDVRKLDQDLIYEREKVATWRKELEKLKNDADRLKKQLDSMEEIVTVVEQLDDDSLTGTLTLDSLAKSLNSLKTRFPDVYKLCSLSTFACFFGLHLFFNEFQRWDPTESHLIVLKDLLQGDEWEQMMVWFIVPKLLAGMHEFQVKVNPADQKVDRFRWVFTWAGVIPVHHMVRIMDVFFDKWQKVLYQWLCSKPDFQQVTDWFLGWRDLIPAELSSNEHIRARLYAGLDMMNRAAEGLEVVQPGQVVATKVQQVDNVGVDLSLKEVVEFHAQQNDLLFKPKAGRMKDGYQVYGFGDVSIVIDSVNQKVFAQVEDGWSLVSLEKLVKLEKNFVMKRRRL